MGIFLVLCICVLGRKKKFTRIFCVIFLEADFISGIRGKNQDISEYYVAPEGRVDNWLIFVYSVILTSSTYINENADRTSWYK